LIRGVFSVFNILGSLDFEEEDYFVVAHPSFYGPLGFHPVASPCVNINCDLPATIEQLFSSNSKKSHKLDSKQTQKSPVCRS